MMSPEELMQRRAEMFYVSPGRGMACHECGCLVANKDEHIGFHLKLDNMDQRANKALTHSHPIAHIPLPEVGTEEWERQMRAEGRGDDV